MNENEKLREIIKKLIENGCHPSCSHEGDKGDYKKYYDAVREALKLGIATDIE